LKFFVTSPIKHLFSKKYLVTFTWVIGLNICHTGCFAIKKGLKVTFFALFLRLFCYAVFFIN